MASMLDKLKKIVMGGGTVKPVKKIKTYSNPVLRSKLSQTHNSDEGKVNKDSVGTTDDNERKEKLSKILPYMKGM